MKQLIRLTESDLCNIIKESVQKVLKEFNDPENLFSDYNPWMNGDASFINGKYEVCDGYYQVEINTSMSYVAIEGEGGEDYFLQGDEADQLISRICKFWSENDCNQEEAIGYIIKHMF